jgi:predicted transcriptional regulator
MSQIDNVLVLLSDGEWHSLSEIAYTLQIDYQKLEKIVELLKEFNLIQHDKLKVRIDPHTKKFLESIQKELQNHKISSTVSL